MQISDDLVSEFGSELHWLCMPCYKVIKNRLFDDRVTEALLKLTQRLSQTEEKLDSKVDATKFDILENMIKELDTKGERQLRQRCQISREI